MNLLKHCVRTHKKKYINSKVLQKNSYKDEDLLEIAIQGVFRAIEKFRKSGGASFITYAVPWINVSIHRYMVANQNLIRTPDYIGPIKSQFIDDKDGRLIKIQTSK